MKVYNNAENMVFDDDDPRCRFYISGTSGVQFAFVQCLDLGWPDRRLSYPGIKRYWGIWDWDDQEDSIQKIMNNGGKWPDLPSFDAFKEHSKLPYQE